MQYFFVMKLQVDKFSKFYIEIYKEFHLSYHPNITDLIYVDEFFCEIKQIHIDIDNDICFINITVTDNIPTCNDKKEVVPILVKELHILSEYDWELVDYHLGDNFKNEDFETIEFPESISRKIGMEEMKFLFTYVKTTMKKDDGSKLSE